MSTVGTKVERTNAAVKQPKQERRVPVVLVLSLASAMICVGVIALLSSGSSDENASPSSHAKKVHVDSRTPERAAESFLDAWRKRDHDTAADLSAGTAHDRVLARKAKDDGLTKEELEVKRRVWDTMAETRLALVLRESEHLPNGQLALRGVAQGTFLDRPYRREMQFTLRREGESWLVTDMQFGTILTPMPDLLEVDPSKGRDPSEFEMRGDEVP